MVKELAMLEVTEKKWTPAQRIGHLRFLHDGSQYSNVQRTINWEAKFMSNIMDMSEKDRTVFPIVELRAALIEVKKTQDVLTKLLTKAFETVREKAIV